MTKTQTNSTIVKGKSAKTANSGHIKTPSKPTTEPKSKPAKTTAKPTNKKKKISTEEQQRIDAFMEYLLECERSKNTRETYHNALKAYFRDFDEITKTNLIAYKEKEIETHKPRTAALRCVAMNQYCDFIGKPECKIKRVKVYGENSVENVPTKEEYYYFLEKLKDNDQMKMYWMLRFIASTGVRASELVKLEKKCLKTGEFSMKTKGKIRRILIPKSLINESKEYFDTVDSKYLFPNRQGDVMQPQSLSKMMAKYGARYDIRPEILHPHAYRHLFAMLFLDNNGNLTLLSNLLGHESVRTTAIYLQMSTERQKEELDKSVTW